MYQFRCELCGTVTEDADFSGPGCVCDGCGLVYQVGPTAESLKMVMAREIRKAKANPPSLGDDAEAFARDVREARAHGNGRQLAEKP